MSWFLKEKRCNSFSVLNIVLFVTANVRISLIQVIFLPWNRLPAVLNSNCTQPLYTMDSYVNIWRGKHGRNQGETLFYFYFLQFQDTFCQIFLSVTYGRVKICWTSTCNLWFKYSLIPTKATKNWIKSINKCIVSNS